MLMTLRWSVKKFILHSRKYLQKVSPLRNRVVDIGWINMEPQTIFLEWACLLIQDQINLHLWRRSNENQVLHDNVLVQVFQKMVKSFSIFLFLWRSMSYLKKRLTDESDTMHHLHLFLSIKLLTKIHTKPSQLHKDYSEQKCQRDNDVILPSAIIFFVSCTWWFSLCIFCPCLTRMNGKSNEPTCIAYESEYVF